jgi:hypothetical protein
MLLNEASPISSNHSKMPTFSVRRPPRTLADLDAQAVELALVFFVWCVTPGHLTRSRPSRPGTTLTVRLPGDPHRAEE